VLQTKICKKVIHINDSDELAKRGLRELVVEMGLREKMKQIHKYVRKTKK
jgi:hypothetical protein